MVRCLRLIVTDHKGLHWLNESKHPPSKVERWRLRLSEYTFQVFHRAGKAHGNADFLSRLPSEKENLSGMLDIPCCSLSIKDDLGIPYWSKEELQFCEYCSTFAENNRRFAIECKALNLLELEPKPSEESF